jgi:predicted enzyme involved in methoxymalonyl-ACP biosynthesis
MTRVTEELCHAADHLFLTVASFNTGGERTAARRAQDLLRAQQESMWLVYVQDRVGDYGPSGLVVCATRGKRLHVTTLLLNCRVLGKQVEHSVALAIGDLARDHSCDTVVFEFHSSARNELAGYFVRSLCNRDSGAADGPHVLPLHALPPTVASLATAPDALTFEIADPL